MKTTIDAVNEFEGEWKYPVDSVGTDAIYFRFNRRCGSYYYYGCHKPYHHEYVCSKDQFNDLVLQMSLNFGKCSGVTAAVYVAGTKELLTKSTKELEVMEIESNDPLIVPESINHRCSYNFTDNPVGELEAGGCSNKRLLEIQTAMSKPLTYTQAMADNVDFLPPVNMLVKHEGVKKIVIGELDYNNNLALKSIGNELYSLGHINDIEPITTPITLIDGECYQGIHKGNGKLYKGVYVKSTDEIWHGKCSNPVGFYTNIKPLTVEVK